MQDIPSDKHVEKLLVGNKCDLESERIVPYERIQEVSSVSCNLYNQLPWHQHRWQRHRTSIILKQVLKQVTILMRYNIVMYTYSFMNRLTKASCQSHYSKTQFSPWHDSCTTIHSIVNPDSYILLMKVTPAVTCFWALSDVRKSLDGFQMPLSVYLPWTMAANHHATSWWGWHWI